MKHRQQFLLQLGAEVDQQVAAGEDVQPGERWVGEQVVRCEHHHFANFLADAVAIAFLDEEAGQAFCRQVFGNAGRVERLPCLGDGVRVEVGGEDLQAVPHQ